MTNAMVAHGRVQAAKLFELKTVPTFALSHRNEPERRAYVLAHNKLALNAGWDRHVLAIKRQGLIDLNFDVELRRYIRRYYHELHRLEMISADGALTSAHSGAINSDPGAEHGSLVSGAQLNAMIDVVAEGLGVVASRDLASKEARIRADPNGHITKQATRGLSKEAVMAIWQQVLGSLD